MYVACSFIVFSLSPLFQCALHQKMCFPRQRTLTAKMLFAIFALALVRFHIFGFTLSARVAAGLPLEKDKEDMDTEPRVVPTPTRQSEYVAYKPTWDEGDSPLKGKGKKGKAKAKNTKVEVSNSACSLRCQSLTQLTDQGHRPCHSGECPRRAIPHRLLCSASHRGSGTVSPVASG